MLLGSGLCDELITRPEESYRLCCVVVCDLETSRMGAPYLYDISRLRVKLDGGDEIFLIHPNRSEAYPAPVKLVPDLFLVGQAARAWH